MMGYLKCRGCGKIMPKSEMYRVYVSIYRVGSRTPDKHMSFCHYCKSCVEKLKIIIEHD